MAFLQLRLKFTLLFWLLCHLPSLTSAANIVNRTIDDTFGDSETHQLVSYQPSNPSPWQDQTCADCFIKPDVSKVFMGTYTAATYRPGNPPNMNITMQFNGTAIYVFFVLFNNNGNGADTLTEANFTVDGNSPVLFQHVPNMAITDVLFNQMVFHQQGLENTQHTLVISTAEVNYDVYVNFDYAIYTHVDTADSPASSSATASPTTSSSGGTTIKKSIPTGALVGGIVGGIAVIIAVVSLLVFRLRRQRGYILYSTVKKEPAFDGSSEIIPVDPFTVPPSPQGQADQFHQYYASPVNGIESEDGSQPKGHILLAPQNLSDEAPPRYTISMMVGADAEGVRPP